MWNVVESRAAVKALDTAPHEIVTKYNAWATIVRMQGPQGLRAIKGFHDESLAGKWLGYRSSRLSLTWRVYYRVEKDTVSVYVEAIDPHRYRR